MLIAGTDRCTKIWSMVITSFVYAKAVELLLQYSLLLSFMGNHNLELVGAFLDKYPPSRDATFHLSNPG